MKKLVTLTLVLVFALSVVNAYAQQPFATYEDFATGFNQYVKEAGVMPEAAEWIEKEGSYWTETTLADNITIEIEGDPETGDIYVAKLIAPFGDLAQDELNALSTFTIGTIWATITATGGNPMSLTTIADELGFGEGFTGDGAEYMYGDTRFSYSVSDEGTYTFEISKAE